VRISKEIQIFASGKDEEYETKRAKVSEALSPEQKRILEERGVLSPEEVHRLATKTRKSVGAEPGHKAACHSDVSQDEDARALQDKRN
jgi:phosphomethylpyrimidine synthase